MEDVISISVKIYEEEMHLFDKWTFLRMKQIEADALMKLNRK